MQNRADKISQYKMINFDDVTNENNTEHNPKSPYIPDYPYRISVIGGSGSAKTSVLLNYNTINQLLIKYINMQLTIVKMLD